MDYYIGQDHALRLIREVRRTPGLALVPCDATRVEGWPPGKRFSWRKFVVPGIDSLSHFDDKHRPCLIAPDAASRFKARGVTSPVLSGPLPHGSFLRLVSDSPTRPLWPGNTYYVASPALCMVSAASALLRRQDYAKMNHDDMLVRLITLAMELCGTFARHPDRPHEEEPVYKSGMASSIESARQLLQGLRNVEGARLTYRALALAQESSASPMETLHYVMFCLPPRLGGFGLKTAKLNGVAEVGRASGGIAHLEKMRPDVAWPDDRIAIEHLGSDWHCGPDAVMLDARRVQDYQVAGWKVFPATFADVRTQERFNAFAMHVISALDARGSYGWWDRSMRLLDDHEFLARQRRTLALVLPPSKRNG